MKHYSTSDYFDFYKMFLATIARLLSPTNPFNWNTAQFTRVINFLDLRVHFPSTIFPMWDYPCGTMRNWRLWGNRHRFLGGRKKLMYLEHLLSLARKISGAQTLLQNGWDADRALHWSRAELILMGLTQIEPPYIVSVFDIVWPADGDFGDHTLCTQAVWSVDTLILLRT